MDKICAVILSLLVCNFSTSVHSAVDGLSPYLDLFDVTTTASNALVNILERQGLGSTDPHTARRQVTGECTDEAFFTGPEEVCLTALSTSNSSEIDSVHVFCRTCGEEYVDFLEECDRDESATIFRAVCTARPDKRLCGEFFLVSTENRSSLSGCDGIDLVTCSSQCRVDITEYTDDLGCCVQEIAAVGGNREDIIQLYSSCGVGLPDQCEVGFPDDSGSGFPEDSRSDDSESPDDSGSDDSGSQDDSSSGLGLIIGLHNTILVTISVVCVLY